MLLPVPTIPVFASSAGVLTGPCGLVRDCAPQGVRELTVALSDFPQRVIQGQRRVVFLRSAYPQAGIVPLTGCLLAYCSHRPWFGHGRLKL